MAKQFTYDYNIEITYIKGSKQIDIDAKAISMILIDHDYESNIAPAIYIKMNLDVPLYNDMVINSKSSKLFLNVQISESSLANPVKKDYIKEQFSYFLSTNDLEYDGDLVEDSDSDEVSYKPIVLGLIKSELIDNNNKIINNIFKNTNTASIVHYYTNHMKMIIEPFDNNPSRPLLIIPPVEGISKLLRYLNEVSNFYTTSYRYYLDFSKTYLLSTKGKAIDIKDGTYNTIKIEVKNLTGADVDAVGIFKDTDNKLYVIDVASKDFSISMNKITEKQFNVLHGVDSMGNKSSKKLDIHNEKGSSSKTRMVRLNNLNYLNSMIDEIEATAAVISVNVGDIDGSIIVPYKDYRLTNIKEYKSLDGKYLLIGKKEVIVQSDKDFRCSVSMNFKRIS